MTPVTIAQLRAAPTVDLMTAARALGLGRTKAGPADHDLPSSACNLSKLGEFRRLTSGRQ